MYAFYSGGGVLVSLFNYLFINIMFFISLSFFFLLHLFIYFRKFMHLLLVR